MTDPDKQPSRPEARAPRGMVDRRARDIAVGVPVLLIWQLVEARRARR